MKIPDRLPEIAQKTRLISFGLVLVFAAWMLYSWFQVPEQPVAEKVQMEAPNWVELPSISAEAWGVFMPLGTDAPADEGPLASRFRLAGTFFSFQPGPQGKSMRKAILDDMQREKQHLVAEGDSIGEVDVVSIFDDHAVLREGAREEEIWLGFAGGESAEAQGAAVQSSRSPAGAEAIEVNRFGKRVGTNRWVFEREELMAYYREVVEDPERVASIYLSLKPDYQKDNRIGGYYLDVEGEGDFFRAVGLKPGDVIRRVNSMKMTNQRRAEYFLKEFYQDRLGAVVLDIEREGTPRKLIYMLR